MGCLHVRGDDPRAFASGLSYVQVDKHGITILYPMTYISEDLAHHKLFPAKVDKGGIKAVNCIQFSGTANWCPYLKLKV